MGEERQFKTSAMKNIILSVIVFFIFIVTIEIVFRTTHIFGAKLSWTEPDPLIVYKHTPGKKYWYNKENDHPISGKINNYGFRDKEWSLRKSPNHYRIAVVGDSFVEALQVESDRTFLSLAENQLNKNRELNSNVELMNFGRSDFTQTEEIIVLKNDVLQFSPDMIILFFVPGNDIRDVSVETAHNSLRPFFNISESGELVLDTSFSERYEFKIKTYINWFKQNSALISLVSERNNAFMQQKKKRSAHVSKFKKEESSRKRLYGYLSLCTANPDPAYMRSFQLNKKLIKSMSEFSKENGIRFVLVAIDIRAYIPEIEKGYLTIDPTFDSNFFEDDLRDYAGQLAIDYMGLQRTFRNYYENNSVSLHWLQRGHWNYEGHEVVANALAKKLEPIIYSEEEGE